MTSRVYVGHLNYDVRERDLEKFFKGYGRIREISIKNGFGFVEFEDHRDADDAVYELNGKELLGDRISVELARGMRRGADAYRGARGPMRRSPPRRSRYGPPTRTEYQLTVENLSSRVSWQDLKDFMRQAGEVTYADAHKLRKNEGVVEFATYADMKTAIEKLDNMELSGRKIRLVEERKRNKRRSRSRSRSRSASSRSRSPRRSRSRSRSESRSPTRSRSRSPAKRNNRSASRSRSRSKSKSRDKSRSRSWSPSKEGDAAVKKSASKSPQPENDGGSEK